MQQAASLDQAQQPRKISPVVAGLGAAFVASAVSLGVAMSSPSPVAVPDQAVATTKQCQFPRQLLVSTDTGGGTVRFREGSYLSPPITLSTRPQTVIFPIPRPETTPVEEVITIEGNATNVVTASPITHARTMYPQVTGVLAITARWIPFKTC
jgi:hypothetical protein